MLVVKIEVHRGGDPDDVELVEEIAICNVQAPQGDRHLYEVYRDAANRGIDREPDGLVSHSRGDGAAKLVERALRLTGDPDA